MKETTKTSIFLAIAVLLVILAIATRPVTSPMTSDDLVGKPLFPKFDDPLGIKSLEITRVGSLGQRFAFKVAESGGVWTIPSHENYPADAKDRMPKIAEALTGLTVIQVADAMTESKNLTADHALYGVLDPSVDTGGPSDGMGMRVTVTGPADDVWVDMIIGKAVESPRAVDGLEQPEQLRYVRVAGEPAVYVVALEADRFSTRFEDWIEKNLLDISSFDIKQVFINEYSIDTNSMTPTFLGDVTLLYNADATGAEKWKLDKMMGFRGRGHEYFQQPFPEGEELNVELLDAMVFALNDLKIVDVVRKPEKLRDAILNEASLEQLAADRSLASSGFNIVQMQDLKGDRTKTKVELLSANGDFRITMDNGAVYVLRFGEAASLAVGDDGDGKTNEENIGMNRYLFIMAEFDEASIPKPEPKPPVDVPADADDTKKEEIAKQNEEIEKQNRRALDDYETTLKEGREQAAKLNARFAPWYYVISEEVYKKIHLSRKTIFQPIKPAEAEGAGGDATLDIPNIPGLPTPPPQESAESAAPASDSPTPVESTPVTTPQTETTGKTSTEQSAEQKPADTEKEPEKPTESQPADPAKEPSAPPTPPEAPADNAKTDSPET